MKPMAAHALVVSARQYLLSFPSVTPAMLDRHLTDWKTRRHKTLRGVYLCMLQHATNRQAMPNVIGKVSRLKPVLCGFDPRAVRKRYASNHAALLEAIVRSKVHTAGKINAGNASSLWVVFAKSALSCADFLSAFKSAKEFNAFVGTFYVNEHSKLALPLLLEKELFGFGFALACDFLKESGYREFVKPDTHLTDLARAARITAPDASPYRVFKDVVAYCQGAGLVPYEFDKLLWLVGSGKFYLDDVSVPTRKAQFIEQHLNLT